MVFVQQTNQAESDRVVFPRTKRSGAQRAHVSCAPGLAKPPSGTGVATDLPTCAVPGVANRAARAGRVPPTSRPSPAARSRSPAPGHPVATARGDGPGAMGDVERMMRGGHEWPGAGANKPLNGGRAWRWACYALSVFGSLLSRVGCAPRRENLCHGLSGDDSKPVQASKGRGGACRRRRESPKPKRVTEAQVSRPPRLALRPFAPHAHHLDQTVQGFRHVRERRWARRDPDVRPDL